MRVRPLTFWSALATSVIWSINCTMNNLSEIYQSALPDSLSTCVMNHSLYHIYSQGNTCCGRVTERERAESVSQWQLPGQEVTVMPAHYSCILSIRQQRWHLDLFSVGCSHDSAGDSESREISQASSTLYRSNDRINECFIKVSYCTEVLTARENETQWAHAEKKECHFS